ncbi:MAG: PilZ domain-containing protein [Desulfobacterales bacterium]|nr:MAG: PilZ domain-containing protein [Desulfobacterales bacterium]
MTNTFPELGRFYVTGRLFDLIGKMSEEEQLLLLEQLMENDLTVHLFKLVVEMSHHEQLRLFEQLRRSFLEELPIKTVKLTGKETTMRETIRKPCHIKASCRVAGNTYPGYIIDIGNYGVFIETAQAFAVGQPIQLEFPLPDHPSPLAVSGDVVWSGSQGIGVKFVDLDKTQANRINAFLENKQT